MKNYELETNSYGNVNGIPAGWHSVTLTVAQLKAAGVPFYKACTGFEKSGKYYKPLLCNIIPDDFSEQLQNWKNGKKKTTKKTEAEKTAAWCKRLDKLTGCGLETAEKIAEEKLDYKSDCIWKMKSRQTEAFSRKRESLIRKMERENPLRRIENEDHAAAILAAHERHTGTDYEKKLQHLHELEEWGIIEKGSAKELARTMTMEEIIKL